MSVDARQERFEHIELFGKPALFTNARIETSSVPDNWYCYDLRGSDRDHGRPAMLEALVVVNHAGSILSPEVIPFTKGKDYRSVKGKLNFLGEEMNLRQFCEHHELKTPIDPLKYRPRPAFPEEAGLFYALPAEQDAELGAIGHVRMDFGRRGTKFWHTWHPRGPEELNSPEFKAELQEVVDELRESVLKSYSAMIRYCHGHGGAIKGGLVQNYGYIVETDNYRYCLRCNPVQGDYNAYLSCFDKRVQEMNMAADEDVHQISSKDSTEFLPPIYLAALQGTIRDTENRICRLLFKLAVEMDMMMNVLAAGMEIGEELLKSLRARCVQNVKKINGSITLDSAVEYQQGGR